MNYLYLNLNPLIINIIIFFEINVKIGILMKDYKLEYAVERELKALRHNFILLAEGDDIFSCDVVLTDYLPGKNCILCHDAMECIMKLRAHFYGKKRFSKIIVGIDPGPKPGIAVIGDGNVIEEIQLSHVGEVRKIVDDINVGYGVEHFIVRIGDGDIVNRNKIVNSLVDTYRVEIVNEKNTSESITNRNVESAKVIAFTRGKIVKKPLNIVIRDGYLREIQRKSRIESGGELTISRILAKKVALGDLTLDEAIDIARNKNGKGKGN
jgi:hypothetical protein